MYEFLQGVTLKQFLIQHAKPASLLGTSKGVFIIHLVPLVLGQIICMQEISQKWTKDMHRRQVDMAGAVDPQGHVGQHQVASLDGPTPLAMSLIHEKDSTLPHQR